MALKDVVAIVKDSAAGLREIALVALLAVLLFNPPVLVGWLESSQLEKVGVFGISFEARKAAQESRAQSLVSANQLQDVERRAKAAEAKLAQLATSLEQSIPERQQGSTAAPPVRAAPADLRKLSEQVNAVRRDIAVTRVAAAKAQAGTRKALVAQANAVEKAGGSIRREGWVWAGQIDPRTGRLRDVGEPETVQTPGSLNPKQLAGGDIGFRAATDIYQAPFDGASQPSRIIGVAPAGKTARVADARLIRFARTGLAGRDPDDQILWIRVQMD